MAVTCNDDGSRALIVKCFGVAPRENCKRDLRRSDLLFFADGIFDGTRTSPKIRNFLIMKHSSWNDWNVKNERTDSLFKF